MSESDYSEELKAKALEINPVVLRTPMGQVPGNPPATADFTLYEIVADDGWDRAVEYPEVREFMDRLAKDGAP